MDPPSQQRASKGRESPIIFGVLLKKEVVGGISTSAAAVC
jgi:hypothetical protein